MRGTSSWLRGVGCAAAALAGIVTVSACLAAGFVAAPAAGAEVAVNASGRYDALALRDLSGRRASLTSLVAADGAFAPVELWRGKKGALIASKAKFVAGDVNGDGIGDGIVLYDLGHSRARLYVFISSGLRAKQRTAWTSKAGAFAWSRAKLAVGDVNRDGRDDVIALYDRGRGRATLYRFISTGKKFKMTTGWSARRGFSCAKAQLAAGDATGDGRDDALVLYKNTPAKSTLFVFAATAKKFAKKTFWRGNYAAGRAQLAAGDADSDGKCDAICLYRKPDNSGRLDVFGSTGTAFTAAVWYDGAGGPLPARSCRFAAGDVTGDGRADVVIARRAGSSGSSITTCVAAGASYVPQLWWQGGWKYPTLRLGVAPSPGTIVSDKAEVLDPTTQHYLRQVSTDSAALTFAGRTAQLSRLEAGDVLLAAPSPTFPGGICRKVVSVAGQGGGVVVTTTQATLTDVIEQGEIAVTKRITAADVSQEGVVYRGVRLKSTPKAVPGTLPFLRRDVTDGFGFDLNTTVADTVEVEGSVWLDPDAYVSVELGTLGIESASYTQMLTTTTDLSVSLKASINREIKQTIYKQTLAVITIMVGPVPVVVTPEFEVYVGASGEATAGVTGGVTVNTATSVGASYDGGHWSSSQSCSFDCTPHPPQLFGSLELKGFAGAGLAFEIYGVAGPEAKLEAFSKLEANTADDPWWTLKAGVDAEVGFKVEALDITLLEKTYTLHLFEYVIDQAGSAGSGGGSSHYRAPSVRGKILDAGDGAALHGATVELHRGAGQPDGALVDETHSAGDGTYVFSGIAGGGYTVVVSKPAYADGSRTVTVAAGQLTSNQDVSLTAYNNQGVTGRVITEPGGAPMSGVYVSIRAADSPAWASPLDYCHTSDGNFEFYGVPPGEYKLLALEVNHFSQAVNATVSAGQVTSVTLTLVPASAQGVYGRVVDVLSGLPIAGATVELHKGASSPAGELDGAVTSGPDGSFAFTGRWLGDYTIVTSHPSYITAVRDTSVTRATLTSVGNIPLGQPGGTSMRSSLDGCIRWTEGVAEPSGTFEFWFRPVTDLGGMEYGTVIAEISRDYPNWMGDGPHRWSIMMIRYGSAGVNTVFVFQINENKNDEVGEWHRLTGTTPVHVGVWYHIAAEYGSLGMKLYVNGQIQEDNGYTGAPAANNGASPGGWFSLGDNQTVGSGYMTASGDYKGLCMSNVVRYEGGWFTPPDLPPGGPGTVILDDLIDATNGENLGFVPTP